MLDIEKTALWNSTLAPQANDEFSHQRDRLRGGLLQMRDAVGRFVSEISRDCPNLTVHDLSHLDALWEMADLVAGPEYPLTPVEAFVFGASVLLHDAAQTLIAYPGGIEEIKKTTEWLDLRSAVGRARLEKGLDDNLNQEESDQLLFEVLRSLHAGQAERLATMAWSIGQDKIYLLSDTELRKAFGRSIGRIANSHHWDIDRVANDLRDDLGPSPDMPALWTFSERKVACLLRCADITHIDRRRAPSIMLAAKGISEDSVVHWVFQNKLNRPSVSDYYIIYTSGEDFSILEAGSWWMCYDVVREIDKELRSSNSLLEEIGQKTFRSQRVMGVDTPRSLARYVTTQGWRPVDAELRVSDPVHLARTLGGANLYGADSTAPLRELLQNAIDAVRARRAYEGRDASWGRVKVTVQEGGAGETWLHVDDNGIGMSESTLTGGLLDFGKSFWSSRSLRREFPGLESKNVNFIGKFGIGFFSVFLLGDKVRVVSKRFDAASSSTKVMEFNGLEGRPLLRDASKGELPLDGVTRVSVLVDQDTPYAAYLRGDGFSGSVDFDDFSPNYWAGSDGYHNIEGMVSFVDVSIDYENNIDKRRFSHKHDVLSCDGREFLEKVIMSDDEDAKTVVDVHRERLSVLSAGGEVFGRAALNLTPELDGDRSYRGRRGVGWNRLSVGGMTTQGHIGPGAAFFVGVMRGKTGVAARNRIEIDVPKAVLAEWSSEQVRSIPVDEIRPSQLVSICHNVISIGGDPQGLPFCFEKDKFITYGEFLNKAKDLIEINIPVYGDDSYGGNSINVTMFDVENALSASFGRPLRDGVFVFSPQGDVISEDGPDEDEWADILSKNTDLIMDIDDISDRSSYSLSDIIKDLQRIWNASCEVKLGAGEMYSRGLYDKERGQVVVNIRRAVDL